MRMRRVCDWFDGQVELLVRAGQATEVKGGEFLYGVCPV